MADYARTAGRTGEEDDEEEATSASSHKLNKISAALREPSCDTVGRAGALVSAAAAAADRFKAEAEVGGSMCCGVVAGHSCNELSEGDGAADACHWAACDC